MWQTWPLPLNHSSSIHLKGGTVCSRTTAGAADVTLQQPITLKECPVQLMPKPRHLFLMCCLIYGRLIPWYHAISALCFILTKVQIQIRLFSFLFALSKDQFSFQNCIGQGGKIIKCWGKWLIQLSRRGAVEVISFLWQFAGTVHCARARIKVIC